MPRKGRVSKRERLPDPKYNDVLVQRFVNSVMWDGKKSLARRLVYRALDLMEKRLKEDPLRAFRKAMDNVKPELEVKARRVGGATYQVPVEVRLDRKMSLAIRWILRYARARSEKTHDRKAGRGAYRRIQQQRRRHKEARRHAQDGRGQ